MTTKGVCSFIFISFILLLCPSIYSIPTSRNRLSSLQDQLNSIDQHLHQSRAYRGDAWKHASTTTKDNVLLWTKQNVYKEILTVPIEDEEVLLMRYILAHIFHLSELSVKTISSMIRICGDTVAGILSGVLKGTGSTLNLLARGLTHLSQILTPPLQPPSFEEAINLDDSMRTSANSMESTHLDKKAYPFESLRKRLSSSSLSIGKLFNALGKALIWSGEITEEMTLGLGEALQDSFRSLEILLRSGNKVVLYLLSFTSSRNHPNNLANSHNNYNKKSLKPAILIPNSLQDEQESQANEAHYANKLPAKKPGKPRREYRKRTYNAGPNIIHPSSPIMQVWKWFQPTIASIIDYLSYNNRDTLRVRPARFNMTSTTSMAKNSNITIQKMWISLWQHRKNQGQGQNEDKEVTNQLKFEPMQHRNQSGTNNDDVAMNKIDMNETISSTTTSTANQSTITNSSANTSKAIHEPAASPIVPKRKNQLSLQLVYTITSDILHEVFHTIGTGYQWILSYQTPSSSNTTHLLMRTLPDIEASMFDVPSIGWIVAIIFLLLWCMITYCMPYDSPRYYHYQPQQTSIWQHRGLWLGIFLGLSWYTILQMEYIQRYRLLTRYRLLSYEKHIQSHLSTDHLIHHSYTNATSSSLPLAASKKLPLLRDQQELRYIPPSLPSSINIARKQILSSLPPSSSSYHSLACPPTTADTNHTTTVTTDPNNDGIVEETVKVSVIAQGEEEQYRINEQADQDRSSEKLSSSSSSSSKDERKHKARPSSGDDKLTWLNIIFHSLWTMLDEEILLSTTVSQPFPSSSSSSSSSSSWSAFKSSPSPPSTTTTASSNDNNTSLTTSTTNLPISGSSGIGLGECLNEMYAEMVQTQLADISPPGITQVRLRAFDLGSSPPYLLDVTSHILRNDTCVTQLIEHAKEEEERLHHHHNHNNHDEDTTTRRRRSSSNNKSKGHVLDMIKQYWKEHYQYLHPYNTHSTTSSSSPSFANSNNAGNNRKASSSSQRYSSSNNKRSNLGRWMNTKSFSGGIDVGGSSDGDDLFWLRNLIEEMVFTWFHPGIIPPPFASTSTAAGYHPPNPSTSTQSPSASSSSSYDGNDPTATQSDHTIPNANTTTATTANATHNVSFSWNIMKDHIQYQLHQVLDRYIPFRNSNHTLNNSDNNDNTQHHHLHNNHTTEHHSQSPPSPSPPPSPPLHHTTTTTSIKEESLSSYPIYHTSQFLLPCDVLYLELPFIFTSQDMQIMLSLREQDMQYSMVPELSVSLTGLHIQGRLLMTIQLTPDYPFLGNATMRLSELPELDFQISSFQGGLDLANIPVLYRFVNATFYSMLAQYTDPLFTTIDIRHNLCPSCDSPPPPTLPETFLLTTLSIGKTIRTTLYRFVQKLRSPAKWLDGWKQKSTQGVEQVKKVWVYHKSWMIQHWHQKVWNGTHVFPSVVAASSPATATASTTIHITSSKEDEEDDDEENDSTVRTGSTVNREETKNSNSWWKKVVHRLFDSSSNKNNVV